MLSGSWLFSPMSAKENLSFSPGPSSELVNHDVPAWRHQGDAVDVAPAPGRECF